MKRIIAALCATAFSVSATAKDKPVPPAPSNVPDWRAVRAKGEQLLKGALFDPGSAQITWTEGFRWGYVKPIIGSRVYAWVGCGTINAKNRIGGYVGAKMFYVMVTAEGTIRAESEPTQIASCNLYNGEHVDPQPALLDVPAAAGAPATLSVADELAKLAGLRDKGIITQAEFDAQKAKLLAR